MIRNFLVFFFMMLASASASHACSVCFGTADSVMTQGLNWGIVCLLAVLAVLFILFISFFLSFRKRAKLMPKD